MGFTCLTLWLKGWKRLPIMNDKDVLTAKHEYESAFSYFAGCNGNERSGARKHLDESAERYRAFICHQKGVIRNAADTDKE